MYSIQCCHTHACSGEHINCPWNVCFKLVFDKRTEERGCLNDLLALIHHAHKDGIIPSHINKNHCQRLNETGELSLCTCTTNLCNSSSKNFSLLFLIFTFILSVVLLLEIYSV